MTNRWDWLGLQVDMSLLFHVYTLHMSLLLMYAMSSYQHTIWRVSNEK